MPGSWYLYALGIAAAGAIALAVTQIGPPSSSARTSREVLTAEDGVVQSTVTGSGNVEAGTDVDVNFQTSGTLSKVYVSVGNHVVKDQLLATLDPTAAQLSLEQAQENLTAAQDQLTAVENGTATGSGGSGSGGSGSGGTAASFEGATGTTQFVSDTTTTTRPTEPKRPKRPKRTLPSMTTTTPATTTTTPATTTPRTPANRAPSASTHAGPSSRSTNAGGRPSGSGGATTTTTTTTTTPSPASIASAQAAVIGAEANVQSAQSALSKTKLFAPMSGTIVSLASVSSGDSVSAGTSGSAASNNSSSSASSSSGGASGGAGGSTTAGSLGGSSSGSGSGSAFAEIVNTHTLTMTVAFSESDISKIKVGQAATITMDALSGVELGAHVTSISPVGSSSGGVVSYNATLTADQNDSRVKPGMSASAAVIVAQAQGVTVPNQAVTGTGSLGTVQLMKNGDPVTQPVVVGLRGDSRTQIVNGLSAGQQVVVTIALPSLSSGAGASSTGGSGALGGGRLGLGGVGGGGGFLGGGGGVGIARFRGGGAAP
jgi:multidrug efflux pump subunit AcrA (membrane-fusion protein)